MNAGVCPLLNPRALRVVCYRGYLLAFLCFTSSAGNEETLRVQGMRVSAVIPLAATAAASLFLACSTIALAADAQEDATNIVADQIRAQGYKCDSPQSAKPDPQASKPDEAVWILDCESGSYRVRLIPDMAAKVEKIEKSENGGK